MYGILVNKISSLKEYNHMDLKMLQAQLYRPQNTEYVYFTFFICQLEKSSNYSHPKILPIYSVATVHIDFTLPSVPLNTFSLLAHTLLYKLLTVKTTTSSVHRAWRGANYSMLNPATIPSVIYMAIFLHRSYAFPKEEGFMVFSLLVVGYFRSLLPLSGK